MRSILDRKQADLIEQEKFNKYNEQFQSSQLAQTDRVHTQSQTQNATQNQT